MPAISSTSRPAASTAGLMSAHALVETRSMGSWSGNTSLISASSGSLSGPPLAPTVVRTVGTPRSLAAFASPATLLTRRVRSIDWIENATHGWWSIRISTELSMVIGFGLSSMCSSFHGFPPMLRCRLGPARRDDTRPTGLRDQGTGLVRPRTAPPALANEGIIARTKGARRRGQAATCAAGRDRSGGVLRPLDRPAVHHRLRRRVQARERVIPAPLGVHGAGAVLAIRSRNPPSG